MSGPSPLAGCVSIALATASLTASVGSEAQSVGPPEPPAPVPSQAATRPAPPLSPPTEVTVRAARREPGSIRITQSEVREIPGGFGDAYRALDVLPGVAPIFSGEPFYFIRGAPPGNTGYLIDGIRVPLLFHVGIGPGVLPPALVDHVDFFPGAAPASLGRFSGGMVAASTRAPADALRGEASVRLFDAGALAESPFADHKGSVLAAARYAYPGPLLSLVSPSIRVGYWDYQARAGYEVQRGDRVSVFAFGSHDELARADDQTGMLRENIASDFHRIDLRYDRERETSGRLHVAATLGWGSQGAMPIYAADTLFGVRVEGESQLSRWLRSRIGADIQFDRYSVRQESSPGAIAAVPASTNPPPRNVAGGLHADLVWRPARGVEVVPGARIDFFESIRLGAPTRVVPTVDPRLAARVALGHHMAWLSALGVSHEYPQLRIGLVPGDQASVPGFPRSSATLQTSVQASQGIELLLPEEFLLSATAFENTTYNMTDLTSPCPLDESAVPFHYDCQDRPARGKARGIELLLRRPLTMRMTVMVSYTLSHATRETSATIDAAGVRHVGDFLSPYDRTHVLNAVGAYDLGAHWRAGARLSFYTGHPFSFTPNAPPTANNRFQAFYRMDVRLEKRWLLGSRDSIAFVVEGQNVTFSRDGGSVACAPAAAGERSCRVQPSGALAIPSAGVEWFFF